jgi:hypothetical protein
MQPWCARQDLPNVLPGAGILAADYELRPGIYPDVNTMVIGVEDEIHNEQKPLRRELSQQREQTRTSLLVDPAYVRTARALNTRGRSSRLLISASAENLKESIYKTSSVN